MDFLLELLVEFVLQLVFEIFGAGLDGALHMSARLARSVFKFIFYMLFGALLAYGSVALWPHPLLMKTPNPLISLLLVPFAVAFSTVFFSKSLEKKWEWDIDSSQFFYSLCFAYSFACTRYVLVF